MEIAGLQAFMAVAATGSFSRAAEQLHLTQPAVSKRIRALESALDRRLFDRVGRSVILTEAGRKLQPHATRVLAEIDNCRRDLADLGGEIGGVLRLATSHHIGLHRLPPVLRAFVNEYPQVQLDLRFMDSEAACTAVEQGELELGVVTLPPLAGERLALTPVWEDPLSVVVARGHPLASREQVTADELVAYPAVLPSESTYTRKLVQQVFEPRNLRIKVGLAANYLETIKMLVSVGLGWSVLPDSMLEAPLHSLRLDDTQLQRTLGVVQHTRRTPTGAAAAFLRMLGV